MGESEGRAHVVDEGDGRLACTLNGSDVVPQLYRVTAGELEREEDGGFEVDWDVS